MRYSFLAVFISLVSRDVIHAQNNVREKVLFDDAWQFHLGDVVDGETPAYNDKSWRTLQLPHDWSIENLPAFDPEKRVVLNLARDTWRFAKGDVMGWKEPSFTDDRWPEVNLPLDWGSHSNYMDEDAYGWYRKTILIPKKYKGQELYINLGYIRDVDEVYFNGVLIGHSGSFPPTFESAIGQVRQYKIPDEMIDWGEPQSLALRVYAQKGMGGIIEKADPQIISGAYDSYSEFGRSSGFTKGGIGWYRKTFKVPPSYEGKKVQLLFEGVYRNATIWLNGKKVDVHPNGHTSFWVDISSFLDYVGKNVLAVKVDNSNLSSRWYTGSGIYRHVWLEVRNQIHVDNWGIHITTESLDESGAEINLRARIKNERTDTLNVGLRTEIVGTDNEQVVFDVLEREIKGTELLTINQRFFIASPKAWSLDSTFMYTAVTTIKVNGEFADRVETPFGIRTIEYDTLDGFKLNGQPMLLKGGNVHDNGILGVRSFDDAEEYKVLQLKKHGFNALRCAHNPPSPAFLKACDKHGMLVVLEAFDTWSRAKNRADYSMYFKDWWQKDLTSIVQRDINHPSIIMWSIGNDVEKDIDAETIKLASQLAEKTRSLDPSRPVTASLSGIEMKREYADTFFSTLNLAGYQYAYQEYEKDHANYPDRIMLSLASYPKNAKASWNAVERLPYVIGDFTWSAMDYLGEAGKGWYSFENEPSDLYPWTSAYCGDLDLLGQARPQWYFRKTIWDKRPQAYIMVKPARSEYKTRSCMDWGWQDASRSWSWHGHEMVFFEVYVYSNCERIKLYQNGKVISERKISDEDNNMALFYVPYKPGSLRAIGFNGKNPFAQDVLKTVGLPAQLAMIPNVKSLRANGQDLMFVEIQVQDAKGQLHPMARAPIDLSIKGPAEIIAVGNANPQNTDGMTDLHHSTFNGRCMAVIKSLNREGEVVVEASANGVKTQRLVFQVVSL